MGCINHQKWVVYGIAIPTLLSGQSLHHELERSTMLTGKTHYGHPWAIFNSYVELSERKPCRDTGWSLEKS